jgi:hypothetical protein
MIRRAGWPERFLCAPAAVLLLYMNPVTMVVGAGLLAVAVALHLVMVRRRPTESPDLPHSDTRDTADRS